MAAKDVRLVAEHPTHFVMHDGKATFRIPSMDLSEAMRARIRGMKPATEVAVSERRPAPRGVVDSKTTLPVMDTTPIGYDQPEEKSTLTATELPAMNLRPPPPEPGLVERGLNAIGKHVAVPIIDYADKLLGPAEVEPQRAWRMMDKPPPEFDTAAYARGGQVQHFDDGGMALPPRQGADVGQPQMIDGVYPAERAARLEAAESAARMRAPSWVPEFLGGPKAPVVAAGGTGGGPSGAGGGPAGDMGGTEGGGTQPVASHVTEAPKEAPVAKPTFRAPPEVTPKAPARSGASMGAKPQPAQYSPEQQAAMAEGKAKEAEAAQTAKEHGAYAAQLMADQLETKRIADEAHARGQEILAKHQRAQDDMARIDTSVDPGRFWATRSTGGKIAGILSLALGAFGAGNDGVNRAAGMLNQAIDRDIEAQKAEHTIRLARGKALQEGYQTMYSQAHQMTGDDLAAQALAKSTALGVSQSNLAKITATSAGAQANPAAVMLAAKIGQEKQKNDAEAAHLIAEAHLANAQAAKASGAGAAPSMGGFEALDRYDAAWRQGGGRVGYLTQHVAGTKANDVSDITDATAGAIATEVSGGKTPRTALIDRIKSMMAKPGDDAESGVMKNRALRQWLMGMKRGGGVQPLGPEDIEGD